MSNGPGVKPTTGKKLFTFYYLSPLARVSHKQFGWRGFATRDHIVYLSSCNKYNFK